MDLTKFAELISCNSTNIAKNTLSYLIGNGHANDEWNEALANLYKSFPKEIKEGKKAQKEFLPIILKFFNTYQLKTYNIDIYNEYAELISAEYKDQLKTRNHDWEWEKEPEVVFKNALAFTKALHKKNVFNFIKKYESQFEAFLDKKKETVYKNFDSYNVWLDMIKTDYSKYIDFCKKYDFDRLEILKSHFNEYTNLQYMAVLNNTYIDLFLSDLKDIGKDFLKEKTPSLFPTHLSSSSHGENCFHVLMLIIKEEQYEAAMKYILFFDKELTEHVNLSHYSYKEVEEKLNLSTAENFKKSLNKMNDYYSKQSGNNTTKWLVKTTLENNSWFKFLDKYELAKDLKSNLKENSSETKRKIKI